MARRDPRSLGGGLDRNASASPSKPPEASSVTDADREANASKQSGGYSSNATHLPSLPGTDSSGYEQATSTHTLSETGPISSNRRKGG